MKSTLHCDHCGSEFTAKTSWARFCSLRCRNAWWRHQYKLAEVQAEENRRELTAAEITEVNGLREHVDGAAIVEAIKYGRPAAPIVAENGNGLRRRAL
jgi:hypothetical protein